jgi:hypothetical protein
MAGFSGDQIEQTFNLERLHALTAPTARYAQYSPEVGWSILRSGLVEEGLETIFGYKNIAYDTSGAYESNGDAELSPDDRNEKEGEIGDGFYYISEVSRFGGADSEEVLQGYPNLHTFQENNPGIRVPIWGPDGKQLTIKQDDRAVLGLSILRLVDVLNPKTDALWLQATERPSLGVAIGDVAGAYTHHATKHGISIVKAFEHVIDKLKVRERPPDVINQANKKDRNPISSRRDRLYVIPWINNLVMEVAEKQWDAQGSAHPGRTI